MKNHTSTTTLMLLLIGLLTLTFNTQLTVGEAMCSVIAGSPSVDMVLWTVSPTDFGELYVRPGGSVDLILTIAVDPASDQPWQYYGGSFGPYLGIYGDFMFNFDLGQLTIHPGDSWKGPVGTFTAYPNAPPGQQLTAPDCTYEIRAYPPAEPEVYTIPVTIIATELAPPTALYFNLNPNPASVGETVILRGVLVDELSQPLSNETVQLYARPVAGSWRYLTQLATDERGLFTWEAAIPMAGTFIFAAYYPGSETYESTYNLAVLVVQ